ncbi:MAG TPA: hypothetical protein VFI42_09160 [Thermomicrobiaceae bacterium]|nr:hypothetical protein [Thermomicrobiaceae bacterium]
MSARSDFRDSARDDERRKRDEAKVQGLQTQLDELRALSRELVSRQARLEDQLKTSEANVAQQRLLLEQHRHEVTQSAQARQLEEGRFRQQLVDLQARIDDSTRPIRSLQAHVSELLDSMRRQKDDVGQDSKRFDELRVLIDHLAAHGERQIAVSQALRDSIETVRVEVEQAQRDLLRTDDSVKIVDQESRRRVAEVGQQIQNLSTRLESELGNLVSMNEHIEALGEAITIFPPQFSELREAIERTNGELERVRTQAQERDELTAERVEELRQQFDAQLKDIGEMLEQRLERFTARDEQLDEFDREISYRLSLLEMRVDELRQVDERVRRELWYLHEQRARLHAEHAQQELDAAIEARRAAEQRSLSAPKE